MSATGHQSSGSVRLFFLALLAAFFLMTWLTAGCSNVLRGSENNGRMSQSGTQNASLTISAAASLKDAMEEIKSIYTKENPTVSLTYNFGASGALQQQIEQGAPVDVFVSAGMKQIDELEKKGLLIDQTKRNLLKNRLVLIVPLDSPGMAELTDLLDARIERVALASPESAPAGQYAKEALTKVGMWDALKPRLVIAKDVRQVLTYVETGNVDAGLLYQTDAKVSNKVRIAVTVPEAYHAPIVYPAAVLKGTKHLGEAKRFVDFLLGERAKAVFEKYGFAPAGP